MEIRHRHAIGAEDDFAMQPGHRSFDQVEQDQVLAHDRRGEVKSPESGWLLMPLYQAQGDDGFFLGRPIRRFWLVVALVLRRLRLHPLLLLLPGIRRDPGNPNAYLADRRISRWLVIEIFHLLGFRKHHERGTLMAFIRRRPDTAPILPFPEPAGTDPRPGLDEP
jgi:succinylglutamate desuccinylase